MGIQYVTLNNFLTYALLYSIYERLSQFSKVFSHDICVAFCPIRLFFGNQPSGLCLPMEDLCKNDKSLYGTAAIYLYIENKLTRIQLYRPNMEDSKLMDYAMGKYGFFNLPEGVPKSRWRGNYFWESGNDTIEYIKTDIHDGHVEIINIVSKLYSVGMADYDSKVGEWLDSQQ